MTPDACFPALNDYDRALAWMDREVQKPPRADELQRLGPLRGAVARRLRKSASAASCAARGGDPREPGRLDAALLEVLGLVAEGLRDSEIAARLVLSGATVGVHARATRQDGGAAGQPAAAACIHSSSGLKWRSRVRWSHHAAAPTVEVAPSQCNPKGKPDARPPALVVAVAGLAAWRAQHEPKAVKATPAAPLATSLAAARLATAKYVTNLPRAKADGYKVITQMIPNMGWHFLNPKVTGFDVTKPAILVYEKRGGTWTLGALEWVFPSMPKTPPLPGAKYGAFGAACHYADGTFTPATSQDACPKTSPQSGAAFGFCIRPRDDARLALYEPIRALLGTNLLVTRTTTARSHDAALRRRANVQERPDPAGREELGSLTWAGTPRRA
jgi:hypothetical protein